MKIALVHDYIKEYGGAEKVLEGLHEIFPQAPIYTSVFIPEFLGPHRPRFEKYNIKTSWLQNIPLKAKLISPFRLLAPFVFKGFDLSGFDVIIVSQTGAYFPCLVHKGQAKLFCYTHTTPRYLYGYKTAREWKNNKLLIVLGEIANHFLRLVDFKAAQNVDQFIANSQEVKARIKKFYRKDAVVVYPPAIAMSFLRDTSKKLVPLWQKQESLPAGKAGRFRVMPRMTDKKEYYLTGGRLARAKGIDIIIDAFIKNKKPLKIFGRGFAGYEEELHTLAMSSRKSVATERSQGDFSPSEGTRNDKMDTIEFVGEVTDDEKFTLMKNAKAFVFASFDEDFGITPVEAMSVGTPVIAYESGGVKETVINGKTGLFYKENTPESLISAVKKIEKLKFEPKDCIKQAQKFSEEEFKKKILSIINK